MPALPYSSPAPPKGLGSQQAPFHPLSSCHRTTSGDLGLAWPLLSHRRERPPRKTRGLTLQPEGLTRRAGQRWWPVASLSGMKPGRARIWWESLSPGVHRIQPAVVAADVCASVLHAISRCSFSSGHIRHHPSPTYAFTASEFGTCFWRRAPPASNLVAQENRPISEKLQKNAQGGPVLSKEDCRD